MGQRESGDEAADGEGAEEKGALHGLAMPPVSRPRPKASGLVGAPRRRVLANICSRVAPTC
jgi:hypothetical protein